MNSKDLEEIIKEIFESNGYRVRESKMFNDEFRLFWAPSDMNNGDFEVFKTKDENFVRIAGEIVLAKSKLDKLYYNFELQKKLHQELEELKNKVKLDFYQIEDDGENFFIRMQCVIPVDSFSLKEFVDKVDNFNESVVIIWNKISKLFNPN